MPMTCEERIQYVRKKEMGIFQRHNHYMLPKALHGEAVTAINVMIFVSPQGVWINGRAVTYVNPPVRPVKTSVAEIDRVRP